MTFKAPLAAAAALFAVASAASADILITDSYARSASPMARSGAVFMVIENTGAEDDRLVDARTDFAKRVELHTHIAGDGGVMQMRHVPDGFVVPAEGTHMLARGGDHVMLMGLSGPLKQGESIEVTLVFEEAGEVVVTVPVDLERKPQHGQMSH